jgi:hypothetical protein
LTNWYCAWQFGQLNGVGLSLMARQSADNCYRAQGRGVPPTSEGAGRSAGSKRMVTGGAASTWGPSHPSALGTPRPTAGAFLHANHEHGTESFKNVRGSLGSRPRLLRYRSSVRGWSANFPSDRQQDRGAPPSSSGERERRRRRGDMAQGASNVDRGFLSGARTRLYFVYPIMAHRFIGPEIHGNVYRWQSPLELLRKIGIGPVFLQPFKPDFKCARSHRTTSRVDSHNCGPLSRQIQFLHR